MDDVPTSDQEPKVPNRNPDGTFPKGVSGNPNGRPPGIKSQYNAEIRGFLKTNFLDKAKPETIAAILSDPKLFIAALGEISKSMPKEESLEINQGEPLTIKIESKDA